MDERVIGRYDAVHEAEMAAAYLRSCGIAARISNDLVVGMNPLLSVALGGIEVRVPAESLDEAQEALAALEADDAHSEAESPYRNRPKRSPQRRRRDDSMDRLAGRALLWALAGATLLPLLGTVWSLHLLRGVKLDKLSDRARGERRLAVFVDCVVLGAVLWCIIR